MAHSKNKRDSVRQAYVNKCLSLKDAARINEINYGTARSWKKAALDAGDDWDVARNAARIAEGGIAEITNMLLENFATMAETLMEEIKTDDKMGAAQKVEIMSKLSDAYSKLMASAAKSGTKVAPLAVAMRVLKMLTEFIREYFPDDAPKFIEILEPFSAKVAEALN